jgi:hypothetical protein
VGLEWGPLSLVNRTEELLGRNSSSSGLENQEYGHGDPLCWPCDTLYSQKLALTSPKSDCRSVGIVHLRTKIMKFVNIFVYEKSIVIMTKSISIFWQIYMLGSTVCMNRYVPC